MFFNCAAFISTLITPDFYSPRVWLLLSLILLLLVRFLKIFSRPEKPEIVYSKYQRDNFRIAELVGSCSILNEIYIPPLIWGRCGHIQTATYGLLGHASLRRQFDKRHMIKLGSDGTTVTVDVFEPLTHHSSKRDYTLALCPGIANSSESNYIRTCVHYAQERGYRCAVLNHLGALRDIELTSSRIFSYGGTEELEAMMRKLMELYPKTRFISVGFSMGGNLTTLLLAKMDDKFLSRIVIGLSVCQGYCGTKSIEMYHDWEGGRRIYNYIITENMKRLLRRHYYTAVLPHIKSGLVIEQRLWSATSLLAIDENYSRRVQGFPNAESFYRWVSSLPHIPKLRIPIVFVNAQDDPLVPKDMWEPVRNYAATLPDKAFILTKHGGHLGFLEGSSIAPHSVTWLDRFICELADVAVGVYEPETTRNI